MIPITLKEAYEHSPPRPYEVRRKAILAPIECSETTELLAIAKGIDTYKEASAKGVGEHYCDDTAEEIAIRLHLLVHAFNILPELVEALKLSGHVLNETLECVQNIDSKLANKLREERDKIQTAIALANRVKIDWPDSQPLRALNRRTKREDEITWNPHTGRYNFTPCPRMKGLE